MAEKTGFLDRITNRTAALSALILGMTALGNSVFDLFGELREKGEILQQLPGWSHWGITALLIIIALYLISVGFASKSRLLRPERFMIQPDEPRFLKGREREVQDLGQICDREPLVFFDGESGCGKSALVSAGLLPWCKSDPARPLPLRIDLSGAPWDNGIADLLGRTLWIEQGDLCRELDFKKYPQADAVFQVLIQINARTARMPLLIFDQFDDYQTAYREHFYPAGGSRLLTSQEFLASSHFWSQVAQGVIAQHWHCLVVTRNDTRAGLDAIRFRDARSYTLLRVEQNLIAPLFDEITAPGPDNAPVVDQPELGWNQLRERLLSDLANQEGQILPIQLAVSLDAMRRWRFLTDAQYRTEGGLSGLERLHVQGYVQETARVTGLSVATLVAVLLRLTDPVRKKARRASFNALVQPLIGVSPDVLQQALIMLEERRIVRRVAHAEDAGAEAWLLYHDYLARGVMEAHRASDRWRLLLDEQARVWQRAAGWREKWRLLLPLKTQARLSWEILCRRLHIGTFRSYMAWSLLRLTPVIILPVGVWTYNWWQLQQEMQIAQRTIAALDQDEVISNNEAEYFQLLIGMPWRAKQVALGYALANADASKRALKHIEMLTHVLVGLDRTGERSKIIEKMGLDTLASSKSAPDSRILAGRLLVQVRIAEPQALLQTVLEQINQIIKEVDIYAFEPTLFTLKGLFAKLDPQTIQTIYQHLLEQMNTEKDSIKSRVLASVLLILIFNAQLEPIITQGVPQDLLKRMKNEKDPYVIAGLAAKMEPQTAQAAFKKLLEQINIEKDLIKRDYLFVEIWIFVSAAKLNSQTAQIIFQDLINGLYTGTYINEEQFSMVWDLLVNLDQQAAQAVAQDLLKQMKTLKDPIKREKLVRTLKSTRSLAFAKLEPQIAQVITQDLLEQMDTEKNLKVVLSIAKKLLILATELEPQDTHTITQNLLKWWKSEKGSIGLTDTEALETLQAIQILATKLDPQAFQAIAQDLLRRLETMRKEPERAFAYLVRAPKALAVKLGFQTTQAVPQQQLLQQQQIKFEQDPLGFSDLVRVLLVLSPKLEPQTVQAIAQDLLDRIKTEKDSDVLNELVLALNTLSVKLEPKTAQVAVQNLLEQMKTLKDLYVLKTIAIALKKLEKQSSKVNRPDLIIQLQSYVNVLKGYVGGIIQCREAIIDNIELMTGQKFDGDKWRFVE